MSAEEKEASAPPADNKLQQYPSSPSMPAQNAVYNAEAYNQAYPGAGQMMPAYNQAYAQAMPVQMMPAGYNQAYGAPGQMPMMQQPMMQQPVMQQVQQPGMQMQQPMMQQMAPGQYVGQPQYVANPYATYVASPYPAQYVAVPQTVPEVPSPNMVANVGGGWMTSAGLVNGLCIGYAILSVLSLIVMSLAANLHSGVKVTYSGYTSYSYTIAGGALGWEIFNGLQGWLFAGVLAAMWGYKPAYDGIMKIWGKTSPVTIQWVWLAINAVELIWWMAALGTTASWSTAWNIVCSSSYSSYYTTSSAVSSYCSKTSALLAFTVFCFLGWFASLVMALLEKFAPKVAGSPMGWKGPKADDGVKVVMAPVMAPAATMPMTDAPSNGV